MNPYSYPLDHWYRTTLCPTGCLVGYVTASLNGMQHTRSQPCIGCHCRLPVVFEAQPSRGLTPNGSSIPSQAPSQSHSQGTSAPLTTVPSNRHTGTDTSSRQATEAAADGGSTPAQQEDMSLFGHLSLAAVRWSEPTGQYAHIIKGYDDCGVPFQITTAGERWADA